MLLKFLKKIHHRLLVFFMLKKGKSLFNNRVHQCIEDDKTAPLGKLKAYKIAIIVLNYNNAEIIEQSIDSLIKYNDYNYQIIVIDNQSSDGSLELLSKKYPKQIILKRNLVNGAASGRNLGASLANGADFLIFIDSDQGPRQHHWLDRFLAIMQSNPQLAQLGYDGGFLTQKDLTGPTFEYYSNKAIAKDCLYRTNIDYLTAGGSMVRNSCFKQVSGFDEKFDPHIFEDADLSRKFIDAGYKIAYCPDLPIYHLAHSTTQADQNNKDYLRQYQKNAQYFAKKWLDFTPKPLLK